MNETIELCNKAVILKKTIEKLLDDVQGIVQTNPTLLDLKQAENELIGAVYEYTAACGHFINKIKDDRL